MGEPAINDIDIDHLEIIALAADAALSAPADNRSADESMERFGDTFTPELVLKLLALARLSHQPPGSERVG